MLELKVLQVVAIPNGMVRLSMVRRSFKARIEPLPQTEEQRIARNIASQIQDTLGTTFPGSVIIGPGGPASPQWDARIDVQITEDEYNQLGKPGINDLIRIEMTKIG